MKRLLALAAVVALLPACGVAPTAPQARTTAAVAAKAIDEAQAKALFTLVDADHDGFVTAAEMLAAPINPPDGSAWKPGQKEATIAFLFQLVDKNGDQKLTFEEIKAAMANQPTTRLRQGDDTEAKARAAFTAIDTDADGAITVTEMLALNIPAPTGTWQPGQKEAMVAFIVKNLDKNGDMQLSFDEFKAGFKPKDLLQGRRAR